jgi:aryl-alcohol dehydrogenase-like predicted oxidoreductase
MSEEMTYAHLGRSGLMVSRIGLGTMNFGFTVDESSSFAVMDAAVDAGVNFFDTADVYGGPQSPDMKQGYGIAEETVGRWLQRSGHRDDIVLATKVYQPMGLGPNDRRLSAYHIRRACEASLRRLQDRSHRPVSDAPRRPGHAVGGDLAGDGAAGPRGQDQLRR